MSSLKQLRNRIVSVRSTRRITSAMKMVAVARLRKSQQRALAARPYARKLQRLLVGIGEGAAGRRLPPLMVGRRPLKTVLKLVMMTDRGMCGGLNINLRKLVLESEDGDVKSKYIFVGRKAASLFAPHVDPDDVLYVYENLMSPEPDISQANALSDNMIAIFESGECDGVELFYNNYLSALNQSPSRISLIPFTGLIDEHVEKSKGDDYRRNYDFEPGKSATLSRLVPRILVVQLYRGLIESFASEQAARMTAMDNATRNADRLIEELEQEYNRSRQASITGELIEIVSGAEAL